MSLGEKDFLMRQFLMLSRFLSQVLFNKVISGEERILFYDHKTALRNDVLFDELAEMIEAGRINEAENKLFQAFEKEPSEFNFAAAVSFYERLMEMDDGVLEEHDFSRDEVGSGFQDICEMYGILEGSVNSAR